MANNLTVTYKGSTIHTASASGSATLETGGTWCEGDIGLNYEFDESIATLAVTVTNGTATSVVATKGSDIVSLSYSGGTWNTVLPSYGAWTVTITDGTHSNSATVNATQAGLYTVSIYMPDVPSGYTQLEWIEAPANRAYIDTGFKPNGNTKIICYAKTNREVGTNSLYGARNSSSSGMYQFIPWVANSTNATLYYGNQSASATKIDTGVWYLVEQDHGVLRLNGAQVISISNQSFTTNCNLLIWARNDNGTPGNYGHFCVAYFAIYDNGTLVRYYYPAIRKSDSVVGLYDVVNDVFYPSAGTGTFTAGPAV